YAVLIRLWDVATGENTRTLPAPEWVESVAFSKDGRTLVSGHKADWFALGESRLPSVGVWDLTVAEPPKRRFPTPGLTEALVSPDGKTVAWRCCQETLRFLDVATGRELNPLDGHRGAIRALRFSPDGKT